MWPPPIKLKMLIAITIIPLLLFYAKQTSANDEVKYGLGGYTMDEQNQHKKMVMVPENATLLKRVDDVKRYKTNDHADKQFKPCRVRLDEEKDFEVFYDEDTAKEGCTVDFITDNIKEITTDIKVKDTKMGCLEDCGGKELAAMGKNTVPFTYSMSNDDFKKLHKGPPYIEDQKSCERKLTCTAYGAKCMDSATSLQLAWNKCAATTTTARAWIQLVGEPYTKWKAENKPGENNNEYPDEAVFQLSIKMGDNPSFPPYKVPLFDVTGPTGTMSFLKEFTYPDCFLDIRQPIIPKPKFWTIKSDNAELNGKQLLVFHLLPQTATRIFNEEGKLQNAPGPGMPKCKGKLSIAIKNVVGLLQSGATAAGASTKANRTSTIAIPDNSGASTTADGHDNNTTTSTLNTTMLSNVTGQPTEKGAGMPIGLIIGIAAGGVVLLLVIVAIVVWCLCCRNKKPEEDGYSGAEMGVGSGEGSSEDEDTGKNEEAPE